MNAFQTAARDFYRDFRNADFRLLSLALMIAVLAVTSVSFFTDRVNRAIRSQATALLGADILIESTRPINNSYADFIQRNNFRSAHVTEFPSVVYDDEHSQLAQIKAVTSGYPLRGNVEIQSQRGGEVMATTQIPKPGTIWVDERLLNLAGLDIGSSINLGESALSISHLISFEPDRGGSVFQLAPRVIMNVADLEATALLSPASRASYRLLLASDTTEAPIMAKQIETELKHWEHVNTIDEGRPEITSAIARAGRFMGLASMITVILAGAAVAMAARSFSQREIARVAILRSLGAVRKQLWTNYGLRLILLLVVASFIGSFLGYFAQMMLGEMLSEWVNVTLPSPRAISLLTGVGTALITLAGFALPPIMRLIDTPPMRILRAELTAPPVSVWTTMGFIALAMFLLLLWQSQDWRLTSRVFAGMAGGLGVILLLALALVKMLRVILVARVRTSSWRLGLNNISRFSGRSTLLISTFAISFLALSLLGGVKNDLMQAWVDNVPDDAPNYFLINIQPDETTQMNRFLHQHGIDEFRLYPMVRGRLVKINQHSVAEDDYTNERAKRLINHEFNLSSDKNLPKANKIVAGQWFEDEAGTAGGLSVEKELADVLGMKLNDTLTFDIAGQVLTDTITSIREVQWDSMQPNFFIMTSPADMQALPKTFITSLRVPPGTSGFSTALVKQFPGVTTLDLNAILNQVRKIISQASAAVEYVFLFTLLAGIVVLITAVQTQKTERSQEIALLKSWGASSGQIRKAVVTEFAIIGGLAGVVGGGLALIIGWVLASQVFELRYTISWDLLLISALVGVVAVGITGLIIVRRMIDTQPVTLFQKA